MMVQNRRLTGAHGFLRRRRPFPGATARDQAFPPRATIEHRDHVEGRGRDVIVMLIVFGLRSSPGGGMCDPRAEPSRRSNGSPEPPRSERSDDRSAGSPLATIDRRSRSSTGWDERDHAVQL